MDNVVAHEMGHGVARYLFVGFAVPSDPVMLSALAAALHVPAPEVTHSDVINMNFVNDGQLTAWAYKNKLAIERGVSKYATSTIHELFAELWAEYSLSTTPREPAKIYGDYVLAQLAKYRAKRAELRREKRRGRVAA